MVGARGDHACRRGLRGQGLHTSCARVACSRSAGPPTARSTAGSGSRDREGTLVQRTTRRCGRRRTCTRRWAVSPSRPGSPLLAASTSSSSTRCSAPTSSPARSRPTTRTSTTRRRRASGRVRVLVAYVVSLLGPPSGGTDLPAGGRQGRHGAGLDLRTGPHDGTLLQDLPETAHRDRELDRRRHRRTADGIGRALGLVARRRRKVRTAALPARAAPRRWARSARAPRADTRRSAPRSP